MENYRNYSRYNGNRGNNCSSGKCNTTGNFSHNASQCSNTRYMNNPSKCDITESYNCHYDKPCDQKICDSHTEHEHYSKSYDDMDCKDSCSCMRKMPLAMAYVPVQEWDCLYNPSEALCKGTAFPELDLIFCGSRGKM